MNAARNAPVPFERALAARELLSIADVSGLAIRCLRGSVWLTLDHDPRDIVLEAGDRFEGGARRRGLLYALADALVAVEPVGLAAQPAARRAVSPRPFGRTPADVPV